MNPLVETKIILPLKIGKLEFKNYVKQIRVISEKKIFYFEHPHIAPRKKERVQIRYSNKDILIQIRDPGVGHSREEGWVLQGLWGWTFQGEGLGIPGNGLLQRDSRLGSQESLVSYSNQESLALGAPRKL